MDNPSSDAPTHAPSRRDVALPVLLALLLLGACDGARPRADKPQGIASAGCRITVCLAGAMTREDGANPLFGELCRTLPGVLEDCAAGQEPGSGACYPMFDILGVDAALTALVAALDEDHDGDVDAADRACDVAIVGYSWGGVNSARLAAALLHDPRVAAARRTIKTVVAIDPFAPVRALDVPAGVERFFNYRHSSSPPNDCSRSVFLGPFCGFAPRCHASVSCADHDYSLAAADARFNGLAGAEVGHCTIVTAAGPAVQHNVATASGYAGAPPTVPVEIFGDPQSSSEQ